MNRIDNLASLSKSELKAWADAQPVSDLPEDPSSYFHLDRPGIRLVRLSELTARRDPEEDAASVHRSMVFAAAAREGRLDRREPLRISAEPDGTFLIHDGTSSYGQVLRAGWEVLPAKAGEAGGWLRGRESMVTVGAAREEPKSPKKTGVRLANVWLNR